MDLFSSTTTCGRCIQHTHDVCGSVANNIPICRNCTPPYRWINQGLGNQNNIPVRIPPDEIKEEPVEQSNKKQKTEVNDTSQGSAKQKSSESPASSPGKSPGTKNLRTETGKSVLFDDNDKVKLIERLPRGFQITRLSLRVKNPKLKDKENDDEVEVLRHTLTEIISRLQKADENLTCLPWSQTGEQIPLNTQDMPSTIEFIQTYFDQARADPETTNYCDIKIQHVRDCENLKQDVGQWLRNRGHALFRKRLQEERTKPFGWLLLSCWEYNTDSITLAIRNKYHINIDLRWSVIRLHGNEEIGENPIKALTAWAAEYCEEEARNKLYAVYNVGGNYPLGIKMRLIPMSNGLSPRQKENAKICREQQHAFLTSINTYVINTIFTLDGRLRENPIPSLRSIIMNAKTTETQHNLFYAVDASWRPNNTVFVFPIRHTDEAIQYIRTFPGRLLHTYGAACHPLLTADAVKSGKNMRLDPETGVFNTVEDSMMDDIMQFVVRHNAEEFRRNQEAGVAATIVTEPTIFRTDEESDSKNEDDGEDENANTLPQTTETEEQKHITNIVLELCADDAGTFKSGVTRASQQFDGDLSVDRTSMNSGTIADDDSIVSTASISRKSKGDKHQTRRDTMHFANMDILRQENDDLKRQMQSMNERLQSLFSKTDNAPPDKKANPAVILPSPSNVPMQSTPPAPKSSHSSRSSSMSTTNSKNTPSSSSSATDPSSTPTKNNSTSAGASHMEEDSSASK